ncbi:cytochrome c-type biogenesis protein CcmH [Modestobacter sp. DSM 44400]|uniref:cytochrome c-type biogenesis protein CcmH n=1 Tax=Modestobacter sp. DSM 44400 TaxID=1550230 RepID=UPI000896B3DD|nr:cytochrome c-type biogenesis protein [Modestobacter sp. DSM 44400]SDY66239.1 cytochrome c-type biogenesis protein CcmH [Modestobacter sp. DSM 44400]
MSRPHRPRSPQRLLIGLAAVALLALGAAGVWQASQPAGPATPHERAVAVERTLRCPTCQGLSVADSPSSIAAGMRQQVEQQVAAGATADQIRGYFVNRYSDWILLAPPRRGIGWLLWLAPAVALLAGGLLVARTLRRRASTAPGRSEEIPAAELDAAAVFATAPPTADLVEPVAAALADLHAARLDADVDPAGEADVDGALARLAVALRDHPEPVVASPPDPDHSPELEPAEALEPGEAPAGADGRPAAPRRRVSRYALGAAAVLFAGLLAVTLTRAVGDRPAGAVITGDFASAPPAAASGAAGAQLAALRDATRARPQDPAAWLTYATALDQAGQLADAEPAYRTALALDPGNTPATEQYAWLLTRGGAPKEALPLLTPLAQERPDDPQVVLLLGLAQRGAGDPQATTTLRRYLALAPDTPQAGIIRGLLGQTP